MGGALERIEDTEMRLASDGVELAENACSRLIIGAAIEVHRELGPGLLESAYEAALAYELRLKRVEVSQQIHLPIEYKGLRFDDAFRIDLLVSECVVVEVKAVKQLLPIHDAQLRTYLRFSGKRLGMLLNFQVPTMKDGIKRVVLGL